MKEEKSITHHWVQLAMKLALKDVRPPKCVRDGLVKKVKKPI